MYMHRAKFVNVSCSHDNCCYVARASLLGLCYVVGGLFCYNMSLIILTVHKPSVPCSVAY